MIRYFLRHPTAANLLMLAMILAGVLTLPYIKRETFPTFDPPYISASIGYPGATPEEVEESLCMRMEDAINGLGNLVESRCRAREGSARLLLKMEEDADISKALIDVQTRIKAIDDFPDQIRAPIVQEFEWSEPVVDLAVSADTSLTDLKAYAEQLRQRMKVEAGLSMVSLNHFSDHLLQVELRETDLRRLGLSVAQVASKIGRQNIKLPSGTVETPSKNLLIRFDERKMTPETLAQTIVAASADGGQVRLGDIARITDTFENEENRIYFNGKPAAILTISKSKAEDALRLKEQVVNFVEQERLRAPDGVELVLTNDLSSLLWDRLTMMVENGWQGVMLVFIVMWLFFTLRYSFWVAAGLPVAFLGSLACMAWFGLSINIMSLVALLMAIGIMMDDAIVISESVAAHVDKGLPLQEAVYQGVVRVLPGVVSSFLTTVCIFGSLIFLEGTMGAVLRIIPQLLLIVLALSLIEAFLVLPAHLYHSLGRKPRFNLPKWPAKERFLERFEHFRTHRLMSMVGWTVRWRYMFLGGLLILPLISLSLVVGGQLRFIGFPDLDGDNGELRILLPAGSTLAQTSAITDKAVASLKKLDKQYSEQYEQGRPLLENIAVLYNLNRDAGEYGPNVATVRFDMLSAEQRNTLIDDFLDDWRKDIGVLADPLAMNFTQGEKGPSGKAIDIRVQHPDIEVLQQVSLRIREFLSGYSGVSNLMDDMRLGKEELLVRLRPGAENYGIDGQTVASQMRANYYGKTADEIQVGPESLKIQVLLDKRDAADTAGFINMPVLLPNGRQVPLGAVATIEYKRNVVSIRRIGGMRTLTVKGDVDQSLTSASLLNRKMRQELIPELEKQYPGLRFSYSGRVEETNKTGASMQKGFLFGLFGVFAILSLQFRSYLEPLVVMLAIPLAFIGVIWGHLLTGYSLSMPSLLGFVSLAGIVVNDSILLVQYIRLHIKDGEDVLQAVVNASRDRFRAVFLTSVTTAAGLMPILLESSLQAQVVQPMVISIIFGIVASTLLVLFVIPSAYAVLSDFHLIKVKARANNAEA